MTREQLHEIAVRRRGDADMKALLLEIKRLHGVLVRAFDLTAARSAQEGLNRDCLDRQLEELLCEAPAVIEAHRPPRPTEVKQETEGDRAAKRRARGRVVESVAPRAQREERRRWSGEDEIVGGDKVPALGFIRHDT
jgi:hypothetical protein